jgi:hypothetical protein
MLGACSDPGRHACARDEVVSQLISRANQKLEGEMLAQMMQTGIEDTSKKTRDPSADTSGQTKVAIDIFNVRTENNDRPSRTVTCSALVRRTYYVEYPSGRREERDPIASRVDYTIEIADDGGLTLSKFNMSGN